MSLTMAASCLSAMEVGGFAGGMAGGFISDLFGGRRGPVMCVFSLMCCPLCLVVVAGFTGFPYKNILQFNLM